MMDGDRIVETLEARHEKGASRDELLREAVREIERSEERYDWVGVYLLEDGELVLHNYIGRPTDHLRIPVGRGVCGTAVAEERDIYVPDVNEVEDYLACSTETASELVVLIRDGSSGEIYGQIDLDSDERGAFTDRDQRELRTVADWLAGIYRDGGAARGFGSGP